MQAAQERRSNVAARVPLDVLVSLAHSDFDEPFQADAVNLSTGGLSMRAAYLPEIGSRLACSFECPPLGAPLEAEGEVVWAADAGEHMGEFGVRFVSLDARSEQAIRALVGDEFENDGAVTPGARPTARLFLDGVPTPIVARITHRADDLMTVEQDLPFLTLDKAVTVCAPSGASRRGRIGSVDLQLCGELPRLVLQVVFDEPEARTMPGDDRTAPDLVAPTMARAAYADGEAERAAIRRSSAGAIAAALLEQDEDEDDLEDARRQALDAHCHFATRDVRTVHATGSPTSSGRPGREPVQVVRSERGGTPAVEEGDPPHKLALVLATLLPLIARARAAALAHWARTEPALLGAFERQRVAFVALARRAGPAMRRATARTIALTGTFASTVRAKLEARAALTSGQAQKPRRTTAPAPVIAAPADWRARKIADAAPEPAVPKRAIGRYVVLTAAVVGGLILGAYALSGSDEEPLPTTRIPASTPPPSAQPALVPAAIEATVAAPPSATAAPALPIVPVTPTALSAPTYIAGHLPPPTYPTMAAAARPTAPPAGLSTASPYAVDVRGESVAGRDPTLRAPAAISADTPTAPTQAPAPSSAREFGQPSVARGQTFTLRMSQHIEGIVGRPEVNGFNVRIDGALTLDRAAPIAAAHPSVATAMIINRGDHADLAIRFRDGMSPAYRVVARGTALELTIARR